MAKDYESKIVDFVKALKARQSREIMDILAPVMQEVSAFAEAIDRVHWHATVSGASFSDLKKTLRQRGVSEAGITEMLENVRAAQDAFANEIAQSALEAALQHFSDALTVADRLLRE